MSHQSRVESPTKLYHVYGRGVDKNEIFDTKAEKDYFLKCMTNVSSLYDIEFYAYCIMPNHYHLVIECSLKEMAKFMQYCQGNYGMVYNNYHNRKGHVFQGKYNSKIVVTEKYYWSLIRYIHLNPVKAKLVSEPSSYYWSSYNAYFNSSDEKSLLSSKALEMRIKFYNNISDFRYFHNDVDHELFDDIEEEMDMRKLELAEMANQAIKSKLNVESWSDMWTNVNCRLAIVHLLMNEYHYTLKEVSALLEVSIYRLKKEISENDSFGK